MTNHNNPVTGPIMALHFAFAFSLHFILAYDPTSLSYPRPKYIKQSSKYHHKCIQNQDWWLISLQILSTQCKYYATPSNMPTSAHLNLPATWYQQNVSSLSTQPYQFYQLITSNLFYHVLYRMYLSWNQLFFIKSYTGYIVPETKHFDHLCLIQEVSFLKPN